MLRLFSIESSCVEYDNNSVKKYITSELRMALELLLEMLERLFCDIVSIAEYLLEDSSFVGGFCICWVGSNVLDPAHALDSSFGLDL